MSRCILILSFFVMPAHALEKYPAFSDDLLDGRAIWLENCETCHGYGIAGAPNPLRPPDWKDRVNTPIGTLYEHALLGFYGESDTYMPARGGNPALSDHQVKSAVNYMLALAKFYLNNQKE